MTWDTGLKPEQKVAASHIGFHARLLAGPGTGKTSTLTRRVIYLIQEKGVNSGEMLALTFTRAAAHELSQKVTQELGSDKALVPRISTLHSFALRQLLKNASSVTAIPRPVRIADDWEERSIIQEDLKRVLSLKRVDQVRDKLNELSSDWETLAADQHLWEANYRDPQFLGAWQQHRTVYGYTLRSELVYQLKKEMEQNPDFTLEQSFKHILIDEYQDLNACDLAVMKALSMPGAEVFVAGDDDQSIYGFRFAHPEGIRRFTADYIPSKSLDLKECQRCDRKILDLGLFVARLDPSRIDKPLLPKPQAGEGEVRVLWFDDQYEEANSVAKLCKHLMQSKVYTPGNILILIRGDRYGAFSKVLQQALEEHGIPVACRTEECTPLDTNEGREFLGILRLCVNSRDHLAWRTLLQVRRGNLIGPTKIGTVYNLAVQKGLKFQDALKEIAAKDSLIQRGQQAIMELVKAYDVSQDLGAALKAMANKIIGDSIIRDEILGFLNEIIQGSGAQDLPDLLAALSASLGDKEQEIDPQRVNILTMHKAKGLTADAIFIVGAEDEYLPGRQQGEAKEGDERRLLYVSLTRARHTLIITYCKKRKGQQRHTGRDSGKFSRTLTRFLRDAPIRPEPGADYVRSLN